MPRFWTVTVEDEGLELLLDLLQQYRGPTAHQEEVAEDTYDALSRAQLGLVVLRPEEEVRW